MASTDVSIKIRVDGSQKAVTDLAAVDAQIDRAAASAQKGAAAFGRLSKTSGTVWAEHLAGTFRDTGVSINTASRQVENLSARMQRVARDRAFRQLADDANLSALKIARLRAGMGDARGAVSSLTSAVGAAKLAIAAWGAALVYAGNAALEAALRMDRLDKAYTSITGSAQGARGQLAFLQETADRLGLQFQSTALSARTFFAAGKGSSLEPQLNTIFEAVSSAGAALALSQDDIQGAFLALGQMISKGKVQAEELRGQLGERLPGAFQMAARAMSMTTAELDKFMADGKLTAEDLLPRMAKVLRDEYGAAAEVAAQGMQGAVNRLSTEWEQFKAGLIDSDAAVTGINAARGAIGSLREAFDALAAHKDILKSLLAGAGAAAGTALILKFSAAILGADAAVGLLAGRLGLLIPLLVNPWTLALAAVGAAAAGLYYYTQQADATEQAQQALNAAQREAAEINRDLAGQSEASGRRLEQQAKTAQANIDNLAAKTEGLLAELAQPLPTGNWLDDLLGLEMPESSLNSYQRRLVTLRREAGETADFKKLQEQLKDLALEAENDGRMTDALRKAIEDTRRVADLGIKLNVEMTGFEATKQKLSQLLYWRSLMGKDAPPVTATDWRERRDAENQKFLDTTGAAYKKTKPGKRETLLGEQSRLRGEMASLATRGLSAGQLSRARAQLSALLAKNQDDLKKLDSKSGSSKIESAARKWEDFARQIDVLNGSTSKADAGLEKTLEAIDQTGKAAGKSSAEIAAMREDYAQAFNSKAIKDLNKELLQLEGNTRDLRDIKIEETMKKFEQGYASAGLSAKEAEPYMERVKKALVEQEDFKDLQTAADFYKELASLSGAYGASIEYQNRLIEKQAKAWELAGIAADDVKKRVDFMKEELSRDPYDGFVRGTRKWVSEATDGAKQIEDLTTSALDGIADSFAELCLTGKASFSDLANSIIADLYRIASRQFIGGIVGGLMGSLGGLFGGGGYASSATSLVNMIPGAAFATGGVAAPSGLPRSGGLLTSPTFFSDGMSRAYASGGLSVAGEAGPEVFMPAARMSDGNYGVRVDMSAVSAQLRAGLSGTTAPNISINVINRTGGQVEAETQARPDGQGGFTLDILLTQVEQGLVARAKSGRSSLMQYQEKAYGLSRASVLTRGRGRA